MQSLHFLVTCEHPLLLEELPKIKFEQMPLLSDQQREHDIQNREEQRIWGKLSGEYLGMKMMVTRYQIRNELISFSGSSLMETLETGGRECLIPCLEVAHDLDILFPSFSCPDTL